MRDSTYYIINVTNAEGSMLPLWKFRYGEEGEEEEGVGERRQVLEVTDIRWDLAHSPLYEVYSLLFTVYKQCKAYSK